MTCILSNVDLTKENSFVRSAGSECEVRWRAGLAWQGAVHSVRLSNGLQGVELRCPCPGILVSDTLLSKALGTCGSREPAGSAKRLGSFCEMTLAGPDTG